jgi:hypothetical protein
LIVADNCENPFWTQVIQSKLETVQTKESNSVLHCPLPPVSKDARRRVKLRWTSFIVVDASQTV